VIVHFIDIGGIDDQLSFHNTMIFS
jgi:hypothetical protein